MSPRVLCQPWSSSCWSILFEPDQQWRCTVPGLGAGLVFGAVALGATVLTWSVLPDAGGGPRQVAAADVRRLDPIPVRFL